MPVEGALDREVTLGVDWFLLNLLLTALIFVPLERLFARLPEQGTFRLGWTTDGLHFLVSHVLVQLISFLILLPSVAATSLLQPAALQSLVQRQPLWLQFLEILLLADLAQYVVHRAFHRVPLLWRFHSVHHSSRDLDWLAGSRLHLVDVVVTRGLVLLPLSWLGFARPALYAYLVFVSFHAVFIHANVRFRLAAVEPLLVTPRFHHWHHAIDAEARDRNFAVHLPWIDRLFGTAHLPGDAWPSGYGIAGPSASRDLPGATAASSSPGGVTLHRRRFGPFELDPKGCELWRDGRKVRIQEQPWRMLALLLEQPGEVVTREELRERLWPAGTFVDFDHSLNTAVKKVRQALDDSPETPRYVETVAKRGYRFIAPVEALAEEPRPEEGARAPAGRARSWGLILGVCAAVALVVVLLARTRAKPSTPAAAGEVSLAVLPLANLSSDAQDDYIAEGLTESLITELAKVPGLLVISRNGVLPYKGETADVKKIGSELRVGHVLEGSIQRSGGRLRVTAQLIDATSAFHIWAEKYDRPAGDLFALQDEIAGRVREALKVSLRPGVSARIPTPSLEAYDAYLRGRFHLHESRRAADARARDEAHAAITHLEKAVALDPRFAAAHAAVGNAYATLFFHFEPDRRWEEQAHVAIEKALALDADLAEAYLARSLLAWTLANGFPHEQAVEDAKRAVALDPSLTEGRWMIARVYEHVGLLDEALAELDVAKRLAPHDLHLEVRQGTLDLYLQRYEEALAFFKKIPEADLDEELALANLYLGREREALAMAQDAARRNPRSSSARSAEALALARLGDQSGALRAVAEAVRLGQGLGHFHHDEHVIASVHALAGRKTEAVDWLRRAADHGFPCYPCFARDPDLAGLTGDPAFETFMSDLRRRGEGYRALARGPAQTSTAQP